MYREAPSPLPGVACLWARWMDGAAARVLPDACVDIVWRSGHGAFVAGPDTGPVLASSPPGTVLVGVRFAPGAGGAALGHPLSDLRDLRVALGELEPALDRELDGALLPDEALQRLNAFAARRTQPDAAVSEAARRLADPRTRVTSLAADLGLSERQLRRRCDAGVGYGPKTLQRVLRFRRFLALGAREDLAGAAFAAGYADQAHLSRECRRLAGLPPAELISSP